MAEKKNEQKKILTVAVLAIGAMVFAYFRFFYKKGPDAPIPGLSRATVVNLEVLKIDYPLSGGKRYAKQLKMVPNMTKLEISFLP